MTRGLILSVAFVFVLAACRPREATPEQEALIACDRACLEDFVEQYVAAVVAHDPALLPITARAKFTENAQVLAFGDGFWGTASEAPSYKIVLADEQAGQAAFLGVMKENDAPVLVGARLKISERKISEIETIVVRSDSGIFNPQGLIEPPAVFTATVQPGARASRDDLIAVANSYFNALETNNGERVQFDDACNRIENGIQMTNNPKLDPVPSPKFNIRAMNCKDNVNSRMWSYITSTTPRRFPIVDTERGLVLGAVMFHHNGVRHPVYVMGVGPVTRGTGRPFSAAIFELFKVTDGKIRQIEAVMATVPYRSKSGWEN